MTGLCSRQLRRTSSHSYNDNTNADLYGVGGMQWSQRPDQLIVSAGRPSSATDTDIAGHSVILLCVRRDCSGGCSVVLKSSRS